MINRFRTYSKTLLNICLPHYCLSCAYPIQSDYQGLCATCWSKTDFISHSYCSQCGYPFDLDVGEDMLCGICLKGDMQVDYMRSIAHYTQTTQKLILQFKQADRLDILPYFTKHIQKTLKTYEHFDYIACVPTPFLRLLKRKYNPSALLALEISKKENKPFIYNLFTYKGFKAKAQKSLKRKQRFEHVKKIYAFNKKYKNCIQGKTILLVDDVCTTGATLNYLATLLKRHGAAKVFAVTVARVVLGEQ
jgi:ComF family protein